MTEQSTDNGTVTYGEAFIDPPKKTEKQKAMDALRSCLFQLENNMAFIYSMHQGRFRSNLTHELNDRVDFVQKQMIAVWNAWLDTLHVVAKEALEQENESKEYVADYIDKAKRRFG